MPVSKVTCTNPLPYTAPEGALNGDRLGWRFLPVSTVTSRGPVRFFSTGASIASATVRFCLSCPNFTAQQPRVGGVRLLRRRHRPRMDAAQEVSLLPQPASALFPQEKDLPLPGRVKHGLSPGCRKNEIKDVKLSSCMSEIRVPPGHGASFHCTVTDFRSHRPTGGHGRHRVSDSPIACPAALSRCHPRGGLLTPCFHCSTGTECGK